MQLKKEQRGWETCMRHVSIIRLTNVHRYHQLHFSRPPRQASPQLSPPPIPPGPPLPMFLQLSCCSLHLHPQQCLDGVWSTNLLPGSPSHVGKSSGWSRTTSGLKLFPQQGGESPLALGFEREISPGLCSWLLSRSQHALEMWGYFTV